MIRSTAPIVRVSSRVIADRHEAHFNDLTHRRLSHRGRPFQVHQRIRAGRRVTGRPLTKRPTAKLGTVVGGQKGTTGVIETTGPLLRQGNDHGHRIDQFRANGHRVGRTSGQQAGAAGWSVRKLIDVSPSARASNRKRTTIWSAEVQFSSPRTTANRSISPGCWSKSRAPQPSAGSADPPLSTSADCQGLPPRPCSTCQPR